MNICPHCGLDLPETVELLCPHCGTALDAEQPSRGAGTAPPHKRKSWWRVARVLLIVLVALGLFAGVLAASAYAGLYFGERDREAARQAVVDTHYDAGIVALNDGRYERAVSEFHYVLQLDPDHVLAEQGVAEARARLTTAKKGLLKQRRVDK